MNKMKFNFEKYNHVLFIFLTLLFLAANVPQLDNNLSDFILTEHRTIFVVLTLFSLSFIFLEFFEERIQLIKEDRQEKKQSLKLKNQLKSLNYDEKYILSLFINEKKTEKALDAIDPNVAWLENLKLIVNTLKNQENKKIFRIDPIVMNELRKNPNLLY